MPAKKTIAIQVMHTDPIMSAGLMAILSEAADMVPALPQHGPLRSARPEIIVADYHSGLAFSRSHQGERGLSPTRVLIVSHLDKEAEVRTAIDAGVRGYLLQRCGREELLTAVRLLSEGERFLSVAVMRTVADSLGRVNLTGRETDVLHLLAQGCCNKLIARELGIGLGTVKTHVKGLISKLEATARTHAVVVATQRGLVGVTPRASSRASGLGAPAGAGWQ